ncbi:MAG: hypothetical protein OHK0011_19830 [Turneriella sp.]
MISALSWAAVFAFFPLEAEDLADRIHRSAVEMTQAFQREDAETLVRYTAQAVLDRTGGASVTAAQIRAEFESNRKEQIRLNKFTIIRPDRIYYLHGQLFALVERKSQWQMDKQTMELRYNILAISTDGGATWRFAELTSIDEKLFRELFGFFDAEFFGQFYKYTSERCNCAVTSADKKK